MGPTKFNLQRFLDAQEDMYPVALKEMKKRCQAQPLDLVYLSSAEGAGI